MPILVDPNDFSPKNEFLGTVFDIAGDATMKELTGKILGANEKEKQRKTFAQLLEKLDCLKGHEIVGRILGELEEAKTNREFLDAMKRIESLIRRVRMKLTEVQILDWSEDPLSPLMFRQYEPTRPVSPLEKIGGQNTIASNAAVFFINRILPILAIKRNEIQKGAHHVGEGVYRDEMEFPRGMYGTGSGIQSTETSVEGRIWKGVKFPPRSEYGPKLLRLSMDPENAGKLITFEELARLFSDGTEPITVLALKQGLIKIDNLFKDAGVALPYEKRHGKGIYFNSPSQTQHTLPTEASGFALNADFLDQPLTFDNAVSAETRIASSVSEEGLTLDMVDNLNLSADDAKVFKYLMNKESVPVIARDIVRDTGVPKTLELQMGIVVERINAVIAPHTEKRVKKTGNVLLFGIIQ